MHPILREINRRQREIASLKRSAELIGLDLSPILPQPTRVGPKKAAAYHRQMAEQLQKPLDKPKPKKKVTKKPDPLEIPAILKRTKPIEKQLGALLGG